MTELTRNDLKRLARLGRRREREAQGRFLVEGVRSVEAAVEAGAPLDQILVTEDAAGQPRVAAFLKRAACPVHVVGAKALERAGDARTAQGVIAVVSLPDRSPDALQGLERVVVLDGVQDPGNVGAVVRAAAWFGIGGVLVGPGTADPFGPKAVRASMGGLWALKTAEAPDLAVALEALKARGVACWGADLEGMPASDWAPGSPAALVLGSEAHGLSAGALERLDGRVRIGGGEAEGPESLNVAVAAGILLHRWTSAL